MRPLYRWIVAIGLFAPINVVAAALGIIIDVVIFGKKSGSSGYFLAGTWLAYLYLWALQGRVFINNEKR